MQIYSFCLLCLYINTVGRWVHTHTHTHTHSHSHYMVPTSGFTKTHGNNHEILLEFQVIKQKGGKYFSSCNYMSPWKEPLGSLESQAVIPYLPMSFWQELFARMVVGPTPPYAMDNSLMMPSPFPKHTLIPELTIASAFCCRWACRKADTNSH